MGTLLGDAISLHHGPSVLEKVEEMRNMAKESRAIHSDGVDSGEERLTPMVDYVNNLTAKELVIISRAFAHFLGVANAAEAHQRCRRLKMDVTKEGSEGLLGALHETKRDSTAGVISQFLNGKGGEDDTSKATKDELYNSLVNQTVELVLTAHPTQVNRRTLLEKHCKYFKPWGEYFFQLLLSFVETYDVYEYLLHCTHCSFSPSIYLLVSSSCPVHP